MLNEFLEASVRVLAHSGSADAVWYAPRLTRLRDGVIVTAPQAIPLEVSDLPSLASTGSSDAADVVISIRESIEELTWFRSSEERVPPGWAHNGAAVECVGSEGMIVEPAFGVGVFYVGPDALYPTYRHGADELYFEVSGR
jgi:hypothetical protein